MRYALCINISWDFKWRIISCETKRETNENDRPIIDRSPWWIPQLKKTDTSPVERELVGFTTTFSYSPDDTINFKLKILQNYWKGVTFLPILIFTALDIMMDMGRDGAIAWEC